ncbi:MAG: kelch repeat-containing protein, partial [Kofleriaceae bacterium]
PRRGGATAALGDGRVVIVGGIDPATEAPSTMLEIVEPDAPPERRVETIDGGPLVSAIAPALATLSDGRVVAFGGRAAGPSAQLVEISGVGAGITLRPLTRASLDVARSHHTATRLSDDLGAPVLVAGGLDAANLAIATAELYKPLIEQTAPAPGAGMVVPRHDHRAVRLPDGTVLIAGGFDQAGNPVRQLEVFSLEQGFTATAGELPPTAGITDQSITPLPDGRILFAGGRDASGTAVDAAFIVRLDTLGGGVDVAITDRLSTPRAGHQATLLCDGTVMLVGGLADDAPAERYNPPAAGRR